MYGDETEGLGTKIGYDSGCLYNSEEIKTVLESYIDLRFSALKKSLISTFLVWT